MDEMSEAEKRMHTKMVNAQVQLEQATIRHAAASLKAAKYDAMYTSGKMAAKAFVLMMFFLVLLNLMIQNEVLQQLEFVTDNSGLVGYPDTKLEIVMSMIIAILFVPMIQHWVMSRK